MKPKIKYPKIDPRKKPELREFAERVGDFIEYWGFKSVQGRMWCYLYLMKEPLSSKQLAQHLGISPALVTQSVQVLLKYRVILEAEKGANGILRFQANPNVAEAISSVLSQREAMMLGQIQVAQRALAKADCAELEPARVNQVGSWVVLARHLLEVGIQSLDQPNINPFEKPEAFEAAIQLK